MKDLHGPGLPKVQHLLFKMSFAIKAVLTSEVALTDLRLLLTPNRLIARLVFRLNHFEIAENPKDTLATWNRRVISSWHPAFPCALPDLSRRHQGDDGGDALGARPVGLPGCNGAFGRLCGR